MSETGKATIHAEKVEDPKCPLCQAELPNDAAPPLSQIPCPACAKEILIPGTLANFRLVRLIGCGGMGAVYEAVDEALKRKVAIKVILRSMTADPSFIETFRREAQSAARLNHPHIVQIYSFGEVCGQPYIAMELVQPDSLDRMMKNGPVSQSTALRIGEEVAEGLKQASEMGIVHGDVKPENILVDENRNAKLADFGIAALAGAHAGANNEVWGTPYYIAPETLRRQKIDHRADIYSLGGTLYHAIAGVPPFEGADSIAVMKARLESNPRPLKDLAPGIPDALNALIMRMLASDPAQRYPTYESLIADMRAVQSAVKPAPLAGKRIVLKGKTPPPASPTPPTPGKLTIPAGITRQGQGEILDPMSLEQFKTVNPQDEAAAGALRVKIFIAVACIVLLALAGLVVGIVLATQKASELKPSDKIAGQYRNETEAEEGLRVLDKIMAQQAEINTLATTLEACATEAVPMLAAIVRDVRRGTRAQFHNRAVPAEPAHAPYAPTLPAAQPQTPAADAPAPAPEPVAKPEPEALPRLIQRSIELHNRFYGLKENALCARDLAGWVEGQHLASQDKMVTLEGLRKIENNISTALAAFKSRPGVTDGKAIVDYIRQSAQIINRDYRLAIQEMKREDQDRLEAEQRAKAVEAERLEQERTAQLEQTEVEAAGMALTEIYTDLQTFDFDAAARKFNMRTAGFKTEKGKAATVVPLEKIERLRSLQAFLMQKLPAFKGRYAISKVTKDRVYINDKPMPWSEITQKRPEVMVEQIRYFLLDDERAKTLKLSERANQSINAALFCTWMIPGNNPTVEKITASLTEYAVRHLPSAQADVNRLFEATP